MCPRLGDTGALGKPDGEEEMGSQGIAVLSDLGVRPPGSSEAHEGGGRRAQPHRDGGGAARAEPAR